MVEGTEHLWHVLGDQDPIVFATDGAIIGLFLVVAFLGARAAIVEFVRRPLS